MKSEVEKLVEQAWYLKSSDEEEQTCVLACANGGFEHQVRLVYNDMFDEFVPADGEYDNPVIMSEAWWEKVRPILDGDVQIV